MTERAKWEFVLQYNILGKCTDSVLCLEHIFTSVHTFTCVYSSQNAAMPCTKEKLKTFCFLAQTMVCVYCIDGKSLKRQVKACHKSSCLSEKPI